MTLWDPWADLSALHRTMDRVFNDAFGQAGAGQRAQTPRLFLPVDVRESETGYVITAPVPGFQPEDIDVTFSEGILTIQAQRTEESRAEEGGYLRREIPFGDLFRQIGLPADVKSDEIKASAEHGMLTVQIPKMSRPQPQRIPIGGSSTKEQLAGPSS
jgi:HSP20 family protein